MVAEDANTRVKEVSSSPNKDVIVRSMATTAVNSESEQGDQLQERAVHYGLVTRLLKIRISKKIYFFCF